MPILSFHACEYMLFSPHVDTKTVADPGVFLEVLHAGRLWP